MQDVFIEYMVKKRPTPQAAVLKVLIVVGAVLVFFVALTFSGLLGAFSIFGMLVGVGGLFGGYYLLTSMNLEYEFIVTNGEMDVDKIMAQRKRRRMVSVNMRQVEAFGRYKAAEHANKEYQTKIFACDHPESPDLWYCTARLKDKGLTLVVFNANERMIEGIKPFLPRPIFHETFRVGS